MIHQIVRGLCVALLLAASSASAQVDPLVTARAEIPALHGVAFERGWNDPAATSIGSEACERALVRLARSGATAVAVDVIGLLARGDSPFLDTPAMGFEEDSARLERTVVAAHRIGVFVVLRLRIDLLDGSHRRDVAMDDERAWKKFFDHLERWSMRWAEVAERLDVDLVVLPSSLSRTTHRDSEWRSLISAVRREYEGPLTYGSAGGDEVDRIGFWSQLDLIGIDLFEPLNRPGDDDPIPRPRPSVWSASDEDSVAVAEIAAELTPTVQRVRAVAEHNARPVLLTATGFRSIEQAWRFGDAPLDRFATPDERDQARAIGGVIAAFGIQPWVRGILWDHYDLDAEDPSPQAGRKWSRSRSVRGKRAFDLLEQFWRTPPIGWAAHRVRGAGGVVVSGDSTATRIGIEVLRDGGNATDAAVATAFVLAVTLPEAGNLGGGGFAVVYEPRHRRARALDFRERAPAAAHELLYEQLYDEGLRDASTRGVLAAGIPGSPAGLRTLWENGGSMPWKRLLRPAFELAAKGFQVSRATAEALADKRQLLQGFESTRDLFLPGGRLLQQGDHLVQPELAAVLFDLMNHGTSGFYRGAIARQLVEGMTRAGGNWTIEDLRAYRAEWRRPIRWPLSRDGRTELITMPPPSAAGVVLGQSWQFLQTQRSGATVAGSADRAQTWIEALRLSFADRNQHLADPNSMHLDPRDLLSASYLRSRARLLPDRGIAGHSDEIEAGWPRRRESDETTHLVVIDARGNAVSLTTTLNGLFGCGFREPSTGILLNNQMDDFDTRPGLPNIYGLVGGGVNRVRPGARMLSSTSPSIVLRDGRTWLALGGRGGPRILSAVGQILQHRIVDGWPLDRAIAAPRLHHQWIPDVVRLQSGHSWPGLARELERRGYTIDWETKSAKIHAAEMTPLGSFIGVADPRAHGLARTVD